MISSQTYFSSSSSTVKKIILHVFSQASPDAQALFFSAWISFPLLPRMSFSKCKEFLLQNLSQFCHFSLWTIRLNLNAPRRLQGMRFLNRSLFLLQFFNFFFIFFFFNLSPVGCSKGSADKILDKQPAPCVAFSRRTLFINPPATDSDTPLRNSCQIENYLKF